ncbi:MAG: protein kinase, partial [Candidatus Aminicenantes bacterium]
MSIRCPDCNTDNPTDSKYCKECATPFYSPKESSISPTKTLKTPLKDLTKGAAVAGKYKLLKNLGEGGMGTVFMAEQTEPVRRRVALKIIKLGMDTKQVVARFEAERQALAVMDHPNVAKVHDGGATETGRPYFVMEFVRGIPITEYCDKNKLSISERLKLFIPLCKAVQHAHQKGLIHRDLKPSNVLVTVQDGKPAPKIIDFGIAKATDHRLTQQTLFTEQGQLIGTPEYMSPEQAEMSGLDIDTRTDIYSLGVMLYELLVGVLPFDSKTLREAGFAEIQKIIQETDAPRASTRLSSLGDTRTSIASHRKTDPDSLHKQLKGDLDWITMKAMAKDRTQRYASASELSSDITKYLKHEPILASPPSTVYRVRKYIKRHKTGVFAAGLIVLALVVGIAGTTTGLIKAKQAEKIAKTEATTAQRVSNFLVDIFEVSDPSEAKGNTITAREILDKGADKITAELQDQPATQARLMNTIGKVYMNLGLYTKSAPLLEEGLERREKEFGENHPDVADSLYSLSQLHYTKAQYEEAKDLVERALNIREKTFGPEHLET